MEFGVTFPQTEIGNDPIAIRDYAQAVEGMGYRYLLAYDHVLGASRTTRPDWTGPYNSETPFHEIFVLFAYLAGQTKHLGLVTGVVILPQRQTALVAKQAASLDLLSGGRLRLGVGVGWNEVEYDGLKAITFKGRWHSIENAGINPLPPRRSIPIWIGGYAEETLGRIGRLADGWTTFRAPDDTMRRAIERVRESATAAGRNPDTIGYESQLTLMRVAEPGWTAFAEDWARLGARYLAINTMGMGFTSVQQHLDALGHAAEVLGVRPG
jgi:alkanesulfonate monooxygenase SsuD/methylene tetrahydromethanopterin reductase-like flavin-dependent oxidoreductase (luciferase family)